MRGLESSIGNSIFFYETGIDKERAEEMFHIHFDTEAISSTQEHLNLTQTSWAKLSEPTRRAFTAWLAQVFAEDIDLFHVISHAFGTRVRVSARRLLPDLEVSLKTYLRRHRGQDTSESLTALYYRGYGMALLPLFGIAYRDASPITLPPARPTLTERLSGAVRFMTGRVR